MPDIATALAPKVKSAVPVLVIVSVCVAEVEPRVVSGIAGVDAEKVGDPAKISVYLVCFAA